MALPEHFNLTLQERRRRSFSETFKRAKVSEIESNQTRISAVCKQYGVSCTAVRQWLNKYGQNSSKKERLIIELMSDTQVIKELREKIANLEQLVGQKQIELEFYKKMIDLAQEHYGIEIKKNSSTQPYDPSGSQKKNTHSV